MKNYYFRTSCTMKEYNCDKWFIMRDYVRDITIQAETVLKALEHYREILNSQYSITISKTAIKRKQPMYRNDKNGCTKQIGYVLTGKTGFESRSDNIPYTEQYIDVWTEIKVISNPFE